MILLWVKRSFLLQHMKSAHTHPAQVLACIAYAESCVHISISLDLT
jgi:hypothetical protein